MRKITEDAAYAFFAGDSFSRDNTVVLTDPRRMLLHGNTIAERNEAGNIVFTLSGWPTPTTRERLNGLFQILCAPLQLYQRDHTQYLAVQGVERAIEAHERFIYSPVNKEVTLRNGYSD